ncbi:sensor histidine kinase N-terminal domain-containing protein [Ramlibacter ginsenosidimutans]|uniref:histidine kinase n=1 Tax=Ramlibacter ginsenosidimutans TaxID=502333 RepID=A0A934TUT5_9BURK|nr:sensor histidine kinase [Ramlibacter ginsenosidimutans]MBK6008009.1 sensor histidine kinase N-terminal domain-containing protein [Ramlibacter ginsenosidimutans]
MPRAEPRLQRKLLAWLLAPLLLLLLLDAAAAYWNAVRYAHLVHDRGLQEIAREIAAHVQPDAGAPRLQLSEAAAQSLRSGRQDRLWLRVQSDAGAVLGGDAAMPPPPPLGPQDGPRFYESRIEGEPVRVLAARLPGGAGADAPRVLVQVAETMHQRDALAWDMMASAVLPQLLLVAITVAIVWFGVSRGLAPLQRLRRAVSDRSHLDLSPIALDDVPGEVRPLVEEVNALMARLARTFDFQSRFVADAAHQLKTPVSGLKAQIELALRETQPERLQHSLSQLYLSADRLSRLVRQLLSLARNEPGALQSLQLQPLDLQAFALDLSMEWVPHAIQRNIDLGFEGGEQPLMIDADPDRLRDLVNNLIDNAIRYTDPGGRVTVRVAPVPPDECQLAISDDGPRIPVAERARVFERFHRLLGTPADGSGLGLAIVSEIATLHGARIQLEEDADGVGNTFTVFFRTRPVAALRPAAPLSAG